MSDEQSNEGTEPQPAEDTGSDDGLQPLPEDESVDLRTIRERNRELKALRERTQQAEQRAAELEQQAMTEQERALSQAREEGYNAARQELAPMLLQERVRAVAAGELNDPEDAVRLLPLDQFGDNPSREAIEQAVLQLLQEKPYLARQQRQEVPYDGGPRGDGPPSGRSGDSFIRGLPWG